MTFRNYLLETFGIGHEYTAIINSSIQLQNVEDKEPFGEIVTDNKGHTVLRVGQTLVNGPIVLVKR